MVARRIVTSALVPMLIVAFAPATAQESDPLYDCIVGCIASRPNSEGWCVQECNRRFGNGREERPAPPTPSFPGGCNPYGTGRNCPAQ